MSIKDNFLKAISDDPFGLTVAQNQGFNKQKMNQKL